MSQTIKITLSIPLIRETIENETFQRSKIDKASQEGAALLSYLEAAETDNGYQSRMFLRDLYSAVEESKTLISDYLNNTGYSVADNISSETQGDNIIYSLEVSSRFNNAMSAPLARALAKYVEDYILVLWWTTANGNLMQVYQGQLANDIVTIRRCFNKRAPKVPEPYRTTTVNVGTTTFSLERGEKKYLSYSIDYGAVDDITTLIADKTICSAVRQYDGFNIEGLKDGTTTLTLISQHDPAINIDVTIEVLPPDTDPAEPEFGASLITNTDIDRITNTTSSSVPPSSSGSASSLSFSDIDQITSAE